MAAIELRGVRKRFPDGTEAVRDASFRIEDGELFILVGPSGCGKSTVLALLAGLEAPTEGDVLLGGRRVNDVDPRDRNVAMVFQSYAIYPHMTVRQNLAFPLELAKRPAAEIRRRVEAVARTLGLEEQLDRKPGRLSGGQRQRVAMGRAMVREPAAFLMDEPLSNLDAALRVQMRAEIRRLQRRLGTTMVYVTHDQTEAMTLGDRIAVMRRGAVEQVGTPRALYERPASRFVGSFIGSPGMSFLPAERRGDRLVLPMTALPLDAVWPGADLAEGTPLVAGVRPEHFRQAAASPAHADGVFTMRVDLVEWLGAELYAHGVVGRSEIVARLPPDGRVRENTELLLRVDPTTLHLFDGRTGVRLGPPPPEGGSEPPL